jgi:hypothetical protein
VCPAVTIPKCNRFNKFRYRMGEKNMCITFHFCSVVYRRLRKTPRGGLADSLSPYIACKQNITKISFGYKTC